MHGPRSVIWSSLVVLTLVLGLRGDAAVEYIPVELDSPGFGFAFGINNQREVVGRATVPSGETHAILWRDGQMVDLGTLPGGSYSEAFAINDVGQVVGFSYNDQSTCTAFDGCWHAFLWQDGTMTDLGGLDPRFQSYAYSINNRGQIAGGSATADYPFGFFHAVVWEDGTQTDLGRPESASDALALGINARGDAVGWAAVNGQVLPFRWSQGAASQLPLPPGSQGAEARKINDRGQIIGQGSNHVLLWTNGAVAELPDVPGAVRSDAYDLNDAGVVVGEGLMSNSGFVAVRWVRGSSERLPAIAGWTESNARGINAQGDVAGAAMTPQGLRAVVWLKQ